MSAALVDAFDLVLFDLDGVVYAGPSALPGAPEHVAQVREHGVSVCFVTNNAARPPEVVADHLTSLGVPARTADVVTSAQAAARATAKTVAPGASVLVVGGVGLVQALEGAGLVPVSRAADEPAAVVQGFHPSVDWTLLTEGAYAVAGGVPWIASNGDRTIPTGRGIAPGNGALIEVIHLATGRRPQIVGKPERPVFDVATERHGAERPVVVGDRLDTDIAGAVAAGRPSLLVLTGVSSFGDLVHAPSHMRPSYVAWTLEALLEPHAEPEVRAGASGSGVHVRCGGWLATAEPTGAVRLDGQGRPHDGLRALAVAVWSLPSQDHVDVDAVQAMADRTRTSGPGESGRAIRGPGHGSDNRDTESAPWHTRVTPGPPSSGEENHDDRR